MEFVNQLNEAYKDIDSFLQQLDPVERDKFQKCVYMSRYPMYEMIENLNWDYFSSNINILEFNIEDEDFYNESRPIDVVDLDEKVDFIDNVESNITQGINLVPIGYNFGESGHQNLMIFFRHQDDIQVLYIEPHGRYRSDYEQYEEQLLNNEITLPYVSLFHFLYGGARSSIKDLVDNEFSLNDLVDLQNNLFDPLNIIPQCIVNLDLIDKKEMVKFYKEMLEKKYIRELQYQAQKEIITPISRHLDYLGNPDDFKIKHYEFDTNNINLQKVDDAGYCETIVVLNMFLGKLITECQEDYCHLNPNFSEIKYTDLVKTILEEMEKVMENKNIFTSKLCREGKWLCAFNVFFFLFCVVNNLFDDSFSSDKTQEYTNQQYNADFKQNVTIDIDQCNELFFGLTNPLITYLKGIINQRVEKIREALLVDIATIYPKIERGGKRIRTTEKVGRKKYKFSTE